MTHASRTKLILFAALAGALAITMGLMARSGVTPAAAGGGCANADAAPNEATVKQFKEAIECLVQSERLSRGKNALDRNAKLNQVAGAHTAVMLNQDCFEHVCPGEGSLTKRLRQVGYLKGDVWAYAESLGYDRTPRQMVDKWMAKSYDRQNILAGKYIDFGIGAGRGTPVASKPDANFVTYTLIFGDGG